MGKLKYFFIRYKNGNEEDWEKVWGLYESSFPNYERHNYPQHLLSMEKENFYCLGVFDSTGMFIGILFYWIIKNYYYIENFAICSHLRSKGFGKRRLEEFIKDNKVIVLIDPIDDEFSEKRWNFYKKLGFKFNKYNFVHPAMSPFLKDHRLEILSYPEYLEKESIKEFENFIIYRVNICK